MTIENITLTEDLQSFVDQQAAERGYETCSEYVRDLIRKEKDRQHLRALVMEGINSPPSVVADDEFFDQLYRRLDDADPQ